MKNLLSLEFRRLLRAKSFYICLAIAMIMILISAATNKMLLNIASSEEFGEAFGAVIQAPTSISMLKSTASSSLTVILAIFLSIFVTEDYASDTIKNVYAKGFSREEVFFAKYVSTLAATFVFFAVCSLFSFAMGKAIFGEIGKAGENLVPSLFAILLTVFAYATIYFTVAVCIKKTGAAIAISIIGPIVLTLLLSLGNAAINSEKINLTDYWLDGRLSILQQANVAGKELLIGFVVSGVALLAAGAIGFFINRASEK